MTSASALDDAPSAVSKISDSRDGSAGEHDECHADGPSIQEDKSKRLNQRAKKRQLPRVSVVATTGKKMRTAVTRTHSPRPVTPAIAAPVWLNRVQKVTPTVPGIENTARHLFRTKARPSAASRSDAHTFLALPTECTYEVCTLLSWAKDEQTSGEENLMREEQLNRRKFICLFLHFS